MHLGLPESRRIQSRLVLRAAGEKVKPDSRKSRGHKDTGYSAHRTPGTRKPPALLGKRKARKQRIPPGSSYLHIK